MTQPKHRNELGLGASYRAEVPESDRFEDKDYQSFVKHVKADSKRKANTRRKALAGILAMRENVEAMQSEE